MSPGRAADAARSLVPLRVRMPLAGWFARNRWFPSADRWAEGLVRDLEDRDPKVFHKFIWEHHLDRYGLAYESVDLFESRKLNSTTKAYDAFIGDLRSALEVMPDPTIRSVLDVGCSVGHVLRALETDVLGGAEELTGVDIDRPATQAGNAYLQRVGSRARLAAGDLENLDALLGERRYDFAYAAGSLSYLDEADTRRAVASILRRTDKLAAFIGLAHPDPPNGELVASVFRNELGRMWTHNFGSMVDSEGWQVISSRWEEPRVGDAQGIYCVFASRLPSPRPVGEQPSPEHM